MSTDSTISAVTTLVAPIVSDLQLDLYDIEFRGGTLRITIDTHPGSAGGVDLDTVALATRLISRELDHHDPIPGRYTLEVTSPGLERTLRTPAHFQRTIGVEVAIRLRDIGMGGERRVQGVLTAADSHTATITTAAGDERVVELSHIDRAKTVFVWGPQPKPGGKGTGKAATKTPARPTPVTQGEPS
jgi:ribosome maturation factor RimP